MELSAVCKMQAKRRVLFNQMWIIMRISLLLLVAALHVSAKGLSQHVTLVRDKITIKEALNEINKQTGYSFIGGKALLESAPLVSLSLKDATIEEAMDQCLQHLPYSYTIQGKIIIIQSQEIALSSDKAVAEPPPGDVHGRITDSLGNPLAGASVTVKGAKKGTQTDADGNFVLRAVNVNALLEITFTGYETQYIRWDGRSAISVKMRQAVILMRDVVINKGYYTEKKSLSTSDVSTVTAKEIGEQPVSDPILALEGRVPGLYIAQASGIPGATYTVLLRGQNSIANGSSPLYIVDGVPYNSVTLTNRDIPGSAVGTTNPPDYPYQPPGGLSPFNNLNPADIENIEVLKDADATAIYGSRGANGVILITTKKGKAGKMRLDVNCSSGVSSIAHRVAMMNTQQYLAMRHEAFRNDSLDDPSAHITPQPSDYDINGAWDTTRYTDWQKALIGNPAHYNTANVTLSGGSATTQVLLGAGYSKQTMVFPGNFKDEKISVRMSINQSSINQKLHIQYTAGYTNDNNLLPSSDLTRYITLAPDAPALLDSTGHINWQKGTWYNPLAYTLPKYKSVTGNLLSSVSFDYEIVRGLKITGNAGYNHSQMNQTNQTPATIRYGPPVASNRRNYLSTANNNTWIVEPQMVYNRAFGRSKVDMTVGSTIEYSGFNNVSYYGMNFLNDALIGNIANAATKVVQNNVVFSYRHSAVYGRFNYNLSDKYVINITARRDGSSRFGPGRQFGNFGAVGAGWLFSRERAIAKALPFLSFGKLRISYGTSGNDEISNYQYLSTYSSFNSYQGVTALQNDRLANQNFAWEVVRKMEGGLELGFFKDRIMLQTSYFRHRTGNQLVGQPLPTIAGFSSVQANLPAVVQNTGLEILLNTTNVRTRRFTWTSSFNITVPRNKLVSFPGLATNASYRGYYVVGQPIFINHGYVYTGVDPQTGRYTVEDVNKDGQINSDQDYQVLGSTTQNYFGGLANGFSYKGWQLDVLFQFTKQNGVNSALVNFSEPGSFNQNQPLYVLGRWQKPGDHTKIEKFSQTFAATGIAWGWASQSNYAITDASFIRLKTVSLSYSLPAAWQRAARLQNSRVYVQAQNLLTITGYKSTDPETQGLSLPPLRTVTAGVQLGF